MLAVELNTDNALWLVLLLDDDDDWELLEGEEDDVEEIEDDVEAWELVVRLVEMGRLPLDVAEVDEDNMP